MKTCNNCGLDKELSEFHKDKHKSDGVCTRCKYCINQSHKVKRTTDPEFRNKCVARSAAYRKNNPEKFRRGVRSSTLKSKYGIDADKYDVLFAVQEGRCATCGYRPSTGEHLDVDHCHETKQVRGLLCRACNTTLGKVKENTETLNNMINYLEAGGSPSRFYF